jgi:hypothetical protein
MTVATLPPTDAGILAEVISGGEPTFSPDTARWILSLRFTERQQTRMLDLAERNNAGELTPAEREEMLRYAHIGTTLSTLHSKARLALRAEPRSA